MEEQPVRKWKVGDFLEAEMFNPNNDCWITYHPARVVRFNQETNAYKCQLLAYGGEHEYAEFDEDQLSIPRGSEPKHNYQINDRVDFFWKKRKVGKRLVDGLYSESGVWVKGIVRVKKDKHFTIEHHDWLNGGTLLKEVPLSLLRTGNPKYNQ